jgi:hypothetical protein
MDTTQIYLHSSMELKEKALAKTKPFESRSRRYRPPDHLLELPTKSLKDSPIMLTSGNKKEANHSVLDGWPLVARHYPGPQPEHEIGAEEIRLITWLKTLILLSRQAYAQHATTEG